MKKFFLPVDPTGRSIRGRCYVIWVAVLGGGSGDSIPGQQLWLWGHAWTPPSAGVPSMSGQEEAPRKTQDTLEWLCGLAGLGTPWGPPGRAGGSGRGEGSLGVPAQAAAAATRSWISGRRWMDGLEAAKASNKNIHSIECLSPFWYILAVYHVCNIGVIIL